MGIFKTAWSNIKSGVGKVKNKTVDLAKRGWEKTKSGMKKLNEWDEKHDRMPSKIGVQLAGMGLGALADAYIPGSGAIISGIAGSAANHIENKHLKKFAKGLSGKAPGIKYGNNRYIDKDKQKAAKKLKGINMVVGNGGNNNESVQRVYI